MRERSADWSDRRRCGRCGRSCPDPCASTSCRRPSTCRCRRRSRCGCESTPRPFRPRRCSDRTAQRRASRSTAPTARRRSAASGRRRRRSSRRRPTRCLHSTRADRQERRRRRRCDCLQVRRTASGADCRCPVRPAPIVPAREEPRTRARSQSERAAVFSFHHPQVGATSRVDPGRTRGSAPAIGTFRN